MADNLGVLIFKNISSQTADIFSERCMNEWGNFGIENFSYNADTKEFIINIRRPPSKDNALLIAADAFGAYSAVSQAPEVKMSIIDLIKLDTIDNVDKTSIYRNLDHHEVKELNTLLPKHGFSNIKDIYLWLNS